VASELLLGLVIKQHLPSDQEQGLAEHVLRTARVVWCYQLHSYSLEYYFAEKYTFPDANIYDVDVDVLSKNPAAF
jgi:hypothetical protein